MPTGHRRALIPPGRWRPLAAVAIVVAAVAGGALALAGREGDGDNASPGGAPDTRAALASVVRSTVLVTGRAQGTETSNGSGWVLDARRGLVVTAAHVINFQALPGRVRPVVTAGGRRRAAEVLGIDPCEDLAVLRVRDAQGLDELPLGRQSQLETGDRLVAAGFPDAAPRARNVVTRETSVIRARGRGPAPTDPGSVALPNTVATDGAISVGTSGGPVVDVAGRVVGVVALRQTSRGDRRTYAIGVDRVRALAGALSAGDSPSWLGKAFGLIWRPARGTRHAVVFTADLVDRPGLPAGAVVLDAVDGRSAGRNATDYCRAMRRAGAGPVELTVRAATVAPHGNYAPSPGAPRRTIRTTFARAGG